MTALFFCYSETSKWWGVFCTECMELVVHNPLEFLDVVNPDNVWVHPYAGTPSIASCERCNHIRSGGTSETFQDQLANALYN